MIETNLGQITHIRTGKLDANAQDINGKYPFFTCGEDILAINQAAFDAEAVLLAGNGNFSVKYYKGKFNAYQRTYVIEPNQINGKWLYYLVANHIAKIITGARGSTIKYLRIGDITNCSVNLISIEHQGRIVAKIEELFSELDKGVESLKTAHAQLKVYRQTLLKHAFEGKLTAHWRKQNKDKLESASALQQCIQTERTAHYQQQIDERQAAGGSRPKAPKALPPLTDEELAELPVLPEGWLGARLGWMTCSVEYGTSAKSSETGICPVLRMGNIQNGNFDLSDLVFTDDKEEIEKYLLKEGDVLFNRTNSPEWVGKSAIFKSKHPTIFGLHPFQ